MKTYSLLLSVMLTLVLTGCALGGGGQNGGTAYLLYFKEADLGLASSGDALRAESAYLTK